MGFNVIKAKCREIPSKNTNHKNPNAFFAQPLSSPSPLFRSSWACSYPAERIKSGMAGWLLCDC